jgi:hypothetical protein
MCIWCKDVEGDFPGVIETSLGNQNSSGDTEEDGRTPSYAVVSESRFALIEVGGSEVHVTQ